MNCDVDERELSFPAPDVLRSVMRKSYHFARPHVQSLAEWSLFVIKRIVQRTLKWVLYDSSCSYQCAWVTGSCSLFVNVATCS